MNNGESLNLCVNDFIASEIIRSMLDGLLVLDPRGTIISINPAALDLLGLRWEEARDRSFSDLFPNDPENEEFLGIFLSCVQTREVLTKKEARFRRPGGPLLDIAVTASPLGGEGQHSSGGAVVFVLRDMTEIKSLDRARHRVLDHLSHELKTPLAILKASIRRIGNTSQGAVMERIERNLDRLQNIQSEVDDIVRYGRVREEYPFRRWLDQVLDLAELLSEGVPSCGDSLRDLRSSVQELLAQETRIEQGRSRLGTCAERVLLAVRRQAAHRNLEFEVRLENDPEVKIAAGTLEKILTAPLKNAIENTPDGGRISLSLEIADQKAVLSIRDTGVGITEESQKQVFAGFYHARETDFYSTKRPFDFGAGGKGLDLLLVRILSQVYGFGIEWESRRCPYISEGRDPCPGSTDKCTHIRHKEECYGSGGTLVKLIFPVAAEQST